MLCIVNKFEVDDKDKMQSYIWSKIFDLDLTKLVTLFIKKTYMAYKTDPDKIDVGHFRKIRK